MLSPQKLQQKRERKAHKRLRLRRFKTMCVVRYGSFVGQQIYDATRDICRRERLKREERLRVCHRLKLVAA